MLAAVVIFYRVVAVVIGLYLGKRVKHASDFLVAGRNLVLLLTMATLAAVQLWKTKGKME